MYNLSELSTVAASSEEINASSQEENSVIATINDYVNKFEGVSEEINTQS